MSTNVYDYEEIYHFNPDDPSRYYDWAIRRGNEEVKSSNFKRAESRLACIRRVNEIVPGARNAKLLAAAFYIIQSGNDPHDFAVEVASDEMYTEFGARADSRNQAWGELMTAFTQFIHSPEPVEERSEE